MCIISTGTRENYINNSCSLGHFCEKHFLITIGCFLGDFYKNNFLTTIKRIFSQVQKNVYFFSLQSMKMNTMNKIKKSDFYKNKRAF